MSEDHRRTFLAFGIIAILLLIWQVFIIGPADRERREELAAQQAAEQAQDALEPQIAPPAASAVMGREEALAVSARIEIDAPGVEGSLALTGARFDDLRLRRHRDNIEEDTLVSLLNPIGSGEFAFARGGWVAALPANTPDLPGGSTEWTLASGNRLTPATPVVLQYASESGLMFTRTISVDENYLFTVADSVENTSQISHEIARYELVRVESMPSDPEERRRSRNLAVFEGPQVVTDGQLTQKRFHNFGDDDDAEETGTSGWAGITRNYWLTAAIPDQTRGFTASYQMIERGDPDEEDDNWFQADYRTDTMSVAPGETITSTGYVFAGAKELSVLDSYDAERGIPDLNMSINWGWLWFLTKPMVWLLNILEGWTGNFGVAILVLTLGIKAVMFPLANRAYASMAKMKNVQPKIQSIRERFKDDPQKMQQEQLELFKKEKINPAAGCVPMLPQIPVFFALFQVLFISLEMRHQPFFGWIRDLSAADPTTMWNLFGLLPFDPAALPMVGGMLGGTGVLALGIWPLLMGVTMWAQQALNPPPPDPMQARIFAFLPVIFTVVLANFPAGLVIYYTWNNLLTVGQQYVIMRRHGNETQLDKLINRLRGGGSKDDAGDKD